MSYESACLAAVAVSSTALATSQAVTGSGRYYGMTLVSGTSVAVTRVTVWDNIGSASGNLLDAYSVSGTGLTVNTNYSMPRQFSKGVYVVVNNTAQASGSVWYVPNPTL
jgi:hypothetical protein